MAYAWLNILSGQQVIINDSFDDWAGNVSAFSDKAGDGNPSRKIDFTAVKVSNDERFLYVYFDISTEINLQENNSVSIFIDIDNNISTGIFKSGIGADMVYYFGPRSGKVYRTNGTYSIFHNDIRLVTAPTVTGSRFEIRILRQFVSDAGQITMGPVIRLLMSDEDVAGDKAPDASGGYTYSFDENRKFNPVPFSIKKTSPELLRILSYNVLKDNIFLASTQASFNRIFKALEPDIIGFCEIYNRTSAQTAALIETFLPSANGKKWYNAEVNPDIRIISRYPILDKKALDGNGAFLIDLGTKKLVFIMAHLPCCDNETDRQKEVDNIMSFVRSVRYGISSFQTPQNTPIVISGDMNLVGLRQQLQTFITGDIQNNATYGPDFTPDWDDSALEDAVPVTTNNSAAFTWYNELGLYSAGRLDFFLYTGSVLSIKNSFALWSPDLTSQQLASSGLQAGDIPTASDHLPIVADFSITGLSTEVVTSDGGPVISAGWNGQNLVFSAEKDGRVSLHDVSGSELCAFDYKTADGVRVIDGFNPALQDRYGLIIVTFRSGTAVKSVKVIR